MLLKQDLCACLTKLIYFFIFSLSAPLLPTMVIHSPTNKLTVSDYCKFIICNLAKRWCSISLRSSVSFGQQQTGCFGLQAAGAHQLHALQGEWQLWTVSDAPALCVLRSRGQRNHVGPTGGAQVAERLALL